MITGIVFHNFIAKVSFMTPYLLFAILLITYCKVSLRNLRPTPLHLWMGCVQFVGCLLVYFLLKPFNPDLGEGTMICVLAPAAAASAVIAGLLGGNVASMAAYCILSTLSVAFLAPSIFSAIGAHGLGEDLSFIHSFLTICAKVFPLLVGPLILALILKKVAPRVHRQLYNKQMYSFWLWAIALTIVMANTTSKIL
ncbi:MAG: transporter, partial [Dysgonamonadaceae bacterium]|nr:transporter [Dysgonamonadaceae bacterium]